MFVISVIFHFLGVYVLNRNLLEFSIVSWQIKKKIFHFNEALF